MLKRNLLKRTLSVIVSMTMIFQPIPATAYAAENETQAVEQAAEESSSVQESEAAPESSIQESEAAPESSSAPESEAAPESSTQESSAQETEAAPESSSVPESEAAPESSTQEESSTGETEAVTEEVSVEESSIEETETATEEGTIEESSVEETETEQETEEDTDLQSIVSESTLSLGEVEVTLKLSSSSDYYGYVFEAPEDGDYTFSIRSTNSSYGNVYFYKNKVNENYTDCEWNEYFSASGYSYSMAMKKGDVRYIAIKPSIDGTFQIGMTKTPSVTSLVETATGYRAETDQFAADIDISTGYQRLNFATKLTAKDGVELANQYRVRVIARKAGDSWKSSSESSMYASNKYYLEQNISYLEMKTDYTISMYLCDYETNEVLYTLISESDNVRRTTLISDKDFVIKNITANYKGFTIEHEAINTNTLYYLDYAPKDDPTAEKRKSLSSYEGKNKIDGLNDDTEYVLTVRNSAGDKVAEETVKTEKYPAKVTYTAKPAGSDKIELSASISEYTGENSQTYVYLYYVVKDEAGEVVNKSNWSGYYADNQITFDARTIDGLEANRKYLVDFYLSESGSSDSRFAPQTVEVTTAEAPFQAEDVTFTLTADETDAAKAKYEIKVKDYTDSLTAKIQYRIKDSGDNYAYNNFTFSNGSSSGTLTFQQKGATYEVRLSIAGIIIIKEYTAGEAEYIAEFTDDTDAYDSVLSFQLKAADGITLDTTESYMVSLAYWNDSSYSNLVSNQTLNSENDYSTTVKTGQYTWFLPGKTYKLRWKVSIPSGYSTKDLYFYQTIQTKTSTVQADIKSSYIDYVEYDLALGGRTENLSDYIYLYQYIKEGDGSYRQLDSSSLSFSSYNNYKVTDRSIANLKAGTKYTISLRNANGVDFGTFSFETPADDKTIEVTETKPYLHRVEMKAGVKGTTYGKNSEYAILYFREKGTDGTWEKKSNTIYASSSSSTFYIYEYNGAELKEDTTYEYVLGIGNGSTQKDNLKAAVTGTFTTKKDERKLQNTTASAGYSYVRIGTNMVDNTNNVLSYIYFFYKVSGTETWKNAGGLGSYGVSYNTYMYIKDLTAGTKYDYAVGIGDSGLTYTTPDQFPDARKAVGTFETKKADYELTFTPDDTASTSNKEVLTVKATGTAEDAKITVELTLDNGQKASVILKQKADYTNKVTFSNLSADTKYTIVSAEIKATEVINNNTQTITVQNIELNKEFTTKQAVVPESIALSMQELKLNLGYDETAKLKVAPTPATASAEVNWSSSDEKIVTVNTDGTVSAQGCGEAVITATSKYDSTLKAECKVSVKSYVVALKDGTEIEPVYRSVEGYKGDISNNVGFYELTADGRYTAISDFTVVSQKPAVADWEDGGIHGKTPGVTDMTFDKDGYKATIKVYVETKKAGFGITALRTSNSSYPAIGRGENTFELAYNENLGLSYQAEGIISPDSEFDASDFTWESSDATVAAVSDTGSIIPKKAGSVKITVKPKNETYLNPDYATAVITLNIKPTPTDSVPEVYAVTNEKPGMKLADVAFPAEWGEGWSWKEPQTPLYSLPVHSDAYAFDATYTGETYYAYQGKVNVYISTIKGVSVSEPSGNHRNVVMVSGEDKTDTLSLQISPTYYGRISASKYTVKIPEVNNLTITENNNTGYFDITANTPGSYTIKPQILIGEKVVATGSYKFKAVAENQIATIALSTDEKEGAVISGNMISFDASADSTKGSSFTLTATASDRSGTENTGTKLAWSITDKSVATISVSADTRTATVNVKGGGHAVIQITAKDAAGVSAQWRLEIQDHKPRIETSKVTVNTAYDYDSSEGRRLAYNQKGSIEIVPVYGESINDVKIIGAQSDEPDTSLGIENYSGYKWVVRPLRADISTSKAYKCRIQVTTSAGTYTYPLTAAIINKAPKVTAKITRGMNLFYIPESGELEVALESSLFSIASMTWDDKAADNGDNAFEFGTWYTYSKKPYSKKYCNIRQDKVRVKNGAFVDAGVDKGTITVKLNGVLEEYEFNIQIKTNYKKPTLKTVGVGTGKNTVNIIPAVDGGNVFHFSVYDNLSKTTLYYTTGNERSKYSYDEITCDSDRISLSAYNNYSGDRYSGMTAVYSGTSQKETVNYAVDSVYWRESLSASQTIKTITPKAVLSRSKLTYNTGYINSELVRIYMSNYSDALVMTDVAIKGVNDKAQALIDDDRLEIIHIGTDLYVQLNKLKYMKGDVPTGKYTYNLTPYYTDTQTGEKKPLNTLKLTINFTNKAVTAKASTKGSIDLAQSYSSNATTNSITATAKFANVGSDYRVTAIRLAGEYSKYFYISTYNSTAENKPTCHIKIKSDQKGKLKAGQSYKLQLVYTLQATGGESIEVTSNTITIKPKQTAPKIKVVNDGQTLYAASDLTRSYTLYAPNNTYGIQDAYGSIDVNKDGKADIVVSKNSTSSNYVYVTVRIADRDAVLATAAGKTYSIPLTVKVIGRDGIAKDSSATIKVKVKR